VGWKDPFKNENHFTSSFKIPENIFEEMFYHESRMTEHKAPYMVYIPRREMMFKMMRLAIGIVNGYDLWFNN
jgi:hypothetical protein